MVAVEVRTYQEREQLKKSFHLGNAQAVSLLVELSEVAGGCWVTYCVMPSELAVVVVGELVEPSVLVVVVGVLRCAI